MEWVYAPKHEKLTPTRWKRELKQLKIEYEELPLILYSDKALSKLREDGIDINIGDVICIYRKSVTFGDDAKYYRRVVYDY